MSYGMEGWGGGFSDPIVDGNGALLIPSEQSPGYQHGVSGWSINKDGSAEFNNIDIRGATIVGNTIIQNENGIFQYYNNPQAGTLIGSWASASGVDQYGNSYPSGFNLNQNGSTLSIEQTENGVGDLRIYLNNGDPTSTSPYIETRRVDDLGNPQFGFVALMGGTSNNSHDYVGLTIASASPDNAVPASGTLFYYDGVHGINNLLVCSAQGIQIAAGSITAVQPGTGTSYTNPPVPETWHTPVLTSNWTSVGASQPVRYRYEGTGSGGVVRLDGEVITQAPVPNGPIFTLPAGYVPATQHVFVTKSDIDVTAGQATFSVLVSGEIRSGQTFTAAGQRLYFDGVTFPLD